MRSGKKGIFLNVSCFFASIFVRKEKEEYEKNKYLPASFDNNLALHIPIKLNNSLLVLKKKSQRKHWHSLECLFFKMKWEACGYSHSRHDEIDYGVL